MTKYSYKTVDLNTIKGIKKAEQLQAKGWVIISYGFYLATFEKRNP